MVALRRQIPPFRPDGYLPEGIYLAGEAEITFRFGAKSQRRRRLALRIRRWIELARKVNALRFFIDGSFITSKPNPNDVDAVVWLPPDFNNLIQQNHQEAIELEQMVLTRRPEELFAAEDQTDWDEWIEFFSQTRETDRRKKGLVEVEL